MLKPIQAGERGLREAAFYKNISSSSGSDEMIIIVDLLIMIIVDPLMIIIVDIATSL